MITRIFVIARERGPILLGNAACQWLRLITVLVEKKAPVVGRFVAAVTREETKCEEVEAYPLLKTGDGAEMTKPTSKPLLAIEAPKKKRKRTKKQNQWQMLQNLWTSLWRALPASLNHLHLRELNQTAHESKTQSFQEVYHMQNSVLK